MIVACVSPTTIYAERDVRSDRENCMAKRSSKSNQQASKKTTSSKRTMRAVASPEEDHIDGCDVEFHDHDATPDAALPVARGGVARVVASRRR
jgi:hypothetical protein